MELKAEQLWAIALAGIMTELNGGSHITLNSEEMSFFNKIVEKKLLKKWWGVKNREGLLETLDEMERSGHTARLAKIKSIISFFVNSFDDFWRYLSKSLGFNSVMFSNIILIY